MELINQLDASISRLSEVILSTANPALAPAQRATAAWPMMSLQAALAWCGVYAVIVGYGLLTKPSAASAKGAAGGKPAAETTLDVVVKRIQVVYNSAQVRRDRSRLLSITRFTRLIARALRRWPCACG